MRLCKKNDVYRQKSLTFQAKRLENRVQYIPFPVQAPLKLGAEGKFSGQLLNHSNIYKYKLVYIAIYATK